MNKGISIIVFLGLILMVFTSLTKDHDTIITRIEEGSNSAIAINYPHTGIRTVDSHINTYVNDVYNTFKHTPPSLSKLNIDFDWRIKNVGNIAKRVINKNCDGKIILMHDTYERTLKALKIIIPELKEKGYQFVTISELNNVKYLRYLNEQNE